MLLPKPANVPIRAETPWVTAESYWQPQLVIASGWIEHAPFAFWLLAALRPTTIVELGTHTGYSFFAMCEAAERLDLGAKIYAVDSWEGDDHAGFYDETVFAEVSRLAQDYPETAVLLRGYFSDHVGAFAKGSVDVLHIDGRHGYEDVKEDFESWIHTVSPTHGVVLLHDIAVKDRGFGVYRYWAELQKQYTTFGFEHGNGLGVVLVGSDLPPALRALGEAGPEDTAAIRRLYAARGALIADHLTTLLELETQQVRQEAEIETFRRSTSWRITRPVRALGSLLRRS